MTLLIRDNAYILFLHVPKCGGSSVVDMFASYGFSPQLQMRGLPPQDCFFVSPQHQTTATLKNIINQDKLTDMFILVRNPYARIKSEFKWAYRNTPSKNLPDFNEWVLNSLNQASVKNFYNDNHFRPAIDFIESDRPCRIFKLEDGIEFIDEYYLQGQGSTVASKRVHSKNSLAFQHKAPDLILNDESIRTVNHFYKNDFSAFGYKIIDNISNLSISSNEEGDDDSFDKKKVELIKKWKDETLEDLKKKIENQILILDNELERLFNYLLKEHGSDNASSCCQLHNQFYDDVLLRLSCRQKLINLSPSDSHPKSNSPERISTLIKLVNQYRARLNSLGQYNSKATSPMNRNPT